MMEFINPIRKLTCTRDHTSLYRFDEVNVEWMATYFMGQEKNLKRGGALSYVDKLKIFLRCVGDPSFQTGVVEDISIHQTTVLKMIESIVIVMFID
jgi:hypothetical protein